MTQLYGHIVEADLDTADPLTAELVKTTENAYRDVQIAFANEVALICEVVGADVWRVRELVNKSPYRQMHLPGAGVGGHCIPKDPWLLAYSARNAHGMVHLIPQARAINDYMPLHVAGLVLEALSNHDVDKLDARVAILGYAYLENSDDTRNSPSEMLYIHLFRSNVEVVVHDPWVSDYQTDLMETVKGCDAAVLMVAHDAYHDLDLAALRSVLRTPILIDGRHFFDAAEAQKAGLYYRCVGQG
jgi:UDP-N-acetyl-D-mannosaminuronic acid dehydrogenase